MEKYLEEVEVFGGGDLHVLFGALGEIDGLAQRLHQRTGCSGILNTLLRRLLMRPKELVEAVGMGRLGAEKILAGDRGGRGRAVVAAVEDSLNAGDRRNRGTVLLVNGERVRDDLGGDQAAVAVMDHDDGILFFMRFLDRHQTVVDRFLTGIAAGNDRLELCDIELGGVCFDNVHPVGQGDDHDLVNAGMTLKRLERVDNQGLVVDMDKLLGDILTHARTDARRCQ